MTYIFRKNGHAAMTDSVTAAPKIFAIFTDFWRLEPRMARGFRQALTEATWSRAVSLRQCLELYEARAGTHHPSAGTHLMHQVCGPQQVITIIEELHTEQLLTRQEASRLEEQILTTIGPAGLWGK